MIVAATADRAAAWGALRQALWPDQDIFALKDEIAEMLADPGLVAFLAYDDGRPIGLAEAALRRDYVNGCESTPVAFLEGLFVAPAFRRRGVACELVAAVADWGRQQGCTELASDALLDNEASHAFHRHVGFTETERVVYFRRLL